MWRLALFAAAVALVSPAVRAGGDRAADGLARLRAGNAQFVADPSAGLPMTSARRAALAQGQSPFATVLSCADSRVPPEVIFRTGLGDLFVVRSAGHVADRAILGTVEYGVEQLHTPLVVVMGHESCGTVAAAMKPGARSTPSLEYLLKAITPAASRHANEPADLRLRAAILAHVEETINTLLETSPLLRDRVERQQLTLAGAYYELASGRVHFSEPVRLIPRRASAAPPSPAPAARKAAPAPASSASQPAPAATPSPAAAQPTPAAKAASPGMPPRTAAPATSGH